jgi:hypothetical protein
MTIVVPLINGRFGPSLCEEIARMKSLNFGAAADSPPGTMGQQKVSKNETTFGPGQHATASPTVHLLTGNRYFGFDLHQFIFGGAGRAAEQCCLGHGHGSPAC